MTRKKIAITKKSSKRDWQDLSEIARKVLEAWDALEEGNWDPVVIDNWLNQDMHPAIANLRDYIDGR